MKLPANMVAGFMDDLARTDNPTRIRTIKTIWIAGIRDKMGAAWGGETQREIEKELDKIIEEMK